MIYVRVLLYSIQLISLISSFLILFSQILHAKDINPRHKILLERTLPKICNLDNIYNNLKRADKVKSFHKYIDQFKASQISADFFNKLSMCRTSIIPATYQVTVYLGSCIKYICDPLGDLEINTQRRIQCENLCYMTSFQNRYRFIGIEKGVENCDKKSTVCNDLGSIFKMAHKKIWGDNKDPNINLQNQMNQYLNSKRRLCSNKGERTKLLNLCKRQCDTPSKNRSKNSKAACQFSCDLVLESIKAQEAGRLWAARECKNLNPDGPATSKENIIKSIQESRQ